MVHEPPIWLLALLVFGVPCCFNVLTWRQWAHESCGDGKLPWRRHALAVGIGANSGVLFAWSASMALALIFGPVFDPWSWAAVVVVVLFPASVILIFIGDGGRSRLLLTVANVVTFFLLMATAPGAFL